MNGQEYVIEIPVHVQDRTSPGSENAQRKVDHFTKYVKTSTSTVLNFEKTVGRAFHSIGRAANTLLTPVKMLKNALFSLPGILGMGAGFTGLIAYPMQLADNLTKAQLAFETMLGSTSKAQKMIGDIKAFAARTPFETLDVIQNSQMMLAYGWKPDRIIKDMEVIGNAMSATGKGKEGIDSVVRALGQMQMKGKVMAQEMMQLTEGGSIKAWDYLAKGMGKSVAQLQKMSEKGSGLRSSIAIDLILKGMTEFNGQMDKLSRSTVGGMLAVIKDTFSLKILAKWGEGLNSGVLKGLQKLDDWLTKNSDKLSKWGDALQKIGEDVSFWLVGEIEKAGDKLSNLFSSDKFKKAGASDKMKIIFDEIIGQPFDDWWNKDGKIIVQKVGSEIGSGLIKAVTNEIGKFAPGGEQPGFLSYILAYLGISKGIKGVGWIMKLFGSGTGASAGAAGAGAAGGGAAAGAGILGPVVGGAALGTAIVAGMLAPMYLINKNRKDAINKELEKAAKDDNKGFWLPNTVWQPFGSDRKYWSSEDINRETFITAPSNDIKINNHYTISASASADDVLKAIQNNGDQVTNEIAGKLQKVIDNIWRNTPLPTTPLP